MAQNNQKNLQKIVQTACAELTLPAPTAIISSSDKSIAKLLAFVRATCDVLLAEYAWQMLQTKTTITTTNGVATYALPTDIQRLTSGTFFDSTNRWDLSGPLTATGYEMIKATNLSVSPFERYRIWNNKIELVPVPGVNPINIVFEYISCNYVIDGNTGIPKADFTQDSDICMFDYRTVVYGVKYRWLASIGQDTTSALIDYKRAYELCKGSDIPAARLSLLGASPSIPLLGNGNITDGNW
jgi:hypothetical protein